MRSQTAEAPRAEFCTSASQNKLQRLNHSPKSICGVIFDGVARNYRPINDVQLIAIRRGVAKVGAEHGQFALSWCGSETVRGIPDENLFTLCEQAK
jgi:hypothetical protein